MEAESLVNERTVRLEGQGSIQAGEVQGAGREARRRFRRNHEDDETAQEDQRIAPVDAGQGQPACRMTSIQGFVRAFARQVHLMSYGSIAMNQQSSIAYTATG